jgi:hypothetical protein
MSALDRRVSLKAARVALVALTLASAAAPAVAAAQSSSDADLKAIGAYTLPTLGERLDGYGNKPLGEQVKLLESVPSVRGAITATGLTTRDYVLTQGALIQAGMAYAMTKDAKMPADEVAKKAGVNKANLEFYQKNEAEIGRLAKEAEARAPKPKEEEPDGEEPAE